MYRYSLFYPSSSASVMMDDDDDDDDDDLSASLLSASAASSLLDDDDGGDEEEGSDQEEEEEEAMMRRQQRRRRQRAAAARVGRCPPVPQQPLDPVGGWVSQSSALASPRTAHAFIHHSDFLPPFPFLWQGTRLSELEGRELLLRRRTYPDDPPPPPQTAAITSPNDATAALATKGFGLLPSASTSPPSSSPSAEAPAVVGPLPPKAKAGGALGGLRAYYLPVLARLASGGVGNGKGNGNGSGRGKGTGKGKGKGGGRR